MGFILGAVFGVIAYFCISSFITAGKCDADKICCQQKRWLYLIPLAVAVLIIIGLFAFGGPGPMHWGGGGLGRCMYR